MIPGDVRGSEPGTGQAGWTWYTGAAGWTWQLAIEGILGVSLQHGAVKIAPHLPKGCHGAEVRVKGPEGILSITIEDPEQIGSGPIELLENGHPMGTDYIALPTGGTECRVTARLRR